MTDNFYKELEWRGLIQDVSDPEGIQKLKKGDPFYVGFDPSGPSLHLGNLVPLIALLHIGRAGLSPIILFGGATGFIGDPSGKDAERTLLDLDTVRANVESQSKQVKEIFERQDIKPQFVNNYDWHSKINFLDLLRDTGKYFTVNYMLAKEVVKSRIEGSGLSYTEFSYMILQGYDFYHLLKEKDCRFQIGGSDQWGNITAGLELIRKKLGTHAYALSLPLITNSEGKKFGKSEDGALFLDPNLTSPYKLHQFLRNTDDRDVGHYLKIFTFLTKEEIDSLEESAASAPQKREAQKMLADQVCTMIHGEDATKTANRSAEVLFGGSIDGLNEEELSEIFSDVPSSSIAADRIGVMSTLDILVDSGAVKSKGDGKRLIQNGGAYINNVRVSDPGDSLQSLGALERSLVVLRTGKKSYHLVKIEG